METYDVLIRVSVEAPPERAIDGNLSRLGILHAVQEQTLQPGVRVSLISWEERREE